MTKEQRIETLGLSVRRAQLPHTRLSVLELLVHGLADSGDVESLKIVGDEVYSRTSYSAEESMTLEELGYVVYRGLNGLKP